jgi:hypothetical protein
MAYLEASTSISKEFLDLVNIAPSIYPPSLSKLPIIIVLYYP